MMNRNKQELDLARRYYDPDDYEDTPRRRDRVSWFGLQLKVATIFRVGFGLGTLMIALVAIRWQFGDRIPWLPVESIWFDIGFLAAHYGDVLHLVHHVSGGHQYVPPGDPRN